MCVVTMSLGKEKEVRNIWETQQAREGVSGVCCDSVMCECCGMVQKRSFEFEMMTGVGWIFTSFTNTIVKAVACGKKCAHF